MLRIEKDDRNTESMDLFQENGGSPRLSTSCRSRDKSVPLDNVTLDENIVGTGVIVRGYSGSSDR
jgi:hypothetical protein